ncbi:hypothetical protein OG413_12555 [Streptomyces sp. NBC_01433]|uniref:hypothetical protein n=1 Tax=Streptomyces sp. NBC_01433 TaxID=2903864 RepID=UPI00225B9579|nr:hypothetical protein [Streptomyces sp. NBC_01433]MCX4676125.1 hypothetical protein [Streptomyces sp. NBC_01433]
MEAELDAVDVEPGVAGGAVDIELDFGVGDPATPRAGDGVFGRSLRIVGSRFWPTRR